MKNEEVAWVFHELADLLEFKGEDFFKIRAYRNACKILAGLDEPLEEIRRRGGLAKIPGIGKNIAAKIEELLATGRLKKMEELLKEIPPGILEIMSLPGIGPKRAGLLLSSLGISSLDELLGAAKQGRVRGLPGMGGKVEKDIIKYIEMREDRRERVLLVTARDLAGEFTSFIKKLPGVAGVDAGGSVRRWRESAGDVDLVVAAADPRRVIEAAAGCPLVSEVLEVNENRVRLQVHWGIEVDLQVVPENQFALALFLNTGSRAHLQRLASLPAAAGINFDPSALPSSEFFSNEREIYARLGLPFIPPELREDRGEVEAALADRLPRLVELGDIKGDLHMHTTWSDGVCTIEQVAARAREKGYEYIALTDHSQSLKIARGLSLERLKEQHRQIRSLNEKMDDIQLLTGIEVDILPKGGLDCPDEILKEADLVVASVHSAFKQDRETMTARIISAVENKNVDIIGHLTGRLIAHREAYAVDVERVLEAAASCGTILEINSSPDRLDLNDQNAARARELGIKMAVNTDAHDLKRMEEMVYGVSVARRAWLEPDDVVNTMPVEKLVKFLRNR
ncbi:DNA polymerase/3'-5' exonuclease PolX [Pelotomaculum propionicicum]|uniref:DNA polymerase beta n=1 Tax=Pelotomaculum propionicicum TaxID=258475 RepID=A0A4Y7RQ99_9FIRM|nr:DNA polymerase/3'-5' exonuclease PolX [Pelotomaculum propionicicum]TEB11041.1 DNA polymerase/3'-5' exonuclease PolX [Pelotomaculum propionicicum]